MFSCAVHSLRAHSRQILPRSQTSNGLGWSHYQLLQRRNASWYRPSTWSSAVRFVAVSGTTFLSTCGGAWWYWKEKREYNRSDTKRAALEMAESELESFSRPKWWVNRDDFGAPLMDLVYDPDFCAVALVGQKGVGKSSIVFDEFSNRKGMVYVTSKKNKSDVYDSLEQTLTDMGVRHPKGLDLRRVLKRMQKIGKDPPVLVFDIESSWSKESVDELIRFTKTYGYGDHLARFLLVFSGSVVPYAQALSSSSQARITAVELPVPNVARLYDCLYALFEDKYENNSKDELHELAKQALEALPKDTFHACTDLVKHVVLIDKSTPFAAISYLQKRHMEDTISGCECLFAKMGLDPKSKNGKAFLERILNGEKVRLGELHSACSDFEKTSEALNTAPHPFYIDPLTQRMYVSSRMIYNGLRMLVDSK